ncbi:hypothetical protein [Kocuria sp. KRD140]|nr:hypothetical protein [Kocuria sp. KRD140]
MISVVEKIDIVFRVECPQFLEGVATFRFPLFPQLMVIGVSLRAGFVSV